MDFHILIKHNLQNNDLVGWWLEMKANKQYYNETLERILGPILFKAMMIMFMVQYKDMFM